MTLCCVWWSGWLWAIIMFDESWLIRCSIELYVFLCKCKFNVSVKTKSNWVTIDENCCKTKWASFISNSSYFFIFLYTAWRPKLVLVLFNKQFYINGIRFKYNDSLISLLILLIMLYVYYLVSLFALNSICKMKIQKQFLRTWEKTLNLYSLRT